MRAAVFHRLRLRWCCSFDTFSSCWGAAVSAVVLQLRAPFFFFLIPCIHCTCVGLTKVRWDLRHTRGIACHRQGGRGGGRGWDLCAAALVGWGKPHPLARRSHTVACAMQWRDPPHDVQRVRGTNQRYRHCGN